MLSCILLKETSRSKLSQLLSFLSWALPSLYNSVDSLSSAPQLPSPVLCPPPSLCPLPFISLSLPYSNLYLSPSLPPTPQLPSFFLTLSLSLTLSLPSLLHPHLPSVSLATKLNTSFCLLSVPQYETRKRGNSNITSLSLLLFTRRFEVVTRIDTPPSSPLLKKRNVREYLHLAISFIEGYESE